MAGRRRIPVMPFLVHLYTASGAVLGLLMVHYAFRGNVEAVLWLFLAAMFIDGTDGFAARYFRVKERLPGLDGSLMDNIIDYLTYAFAPMVLLWENGFLPDGALGPIIASIPLVASCYQFCRTDAKTDDHFFLGFPSYWNVAAFYAIVCHLSEWWTALLLLVCSVLVFVPVKYVYPSRTVRFWWTNMASASLWLILYAVITSQWPTTNNWLIGVSLLCVAHYLVTSLWLTYLTWDQGRKALQAEEDLLDLGLPIN